jgi:choline monooxygenase
VLARFDDSSQNTVNDVVGDEWLGSASDLLSGSGIDTTSLPHIYRREYIIECNWKVHINTFSWLKF